MVNHITVHVAVYVFIFHPDTRLHHKIAELVLDGQISVEAVVPAHSV